NIARYKKQAAALRLGDRVVFTGHQTPEAIRRYMTTSRLVVLGSRMDTSPNIITEAHAAGLPVVATRAGGIPDMVTDQKDGILAGIDDVAELAKGMNTLLNDPEKTRC